MRIKSLPLPVRSRLSPTREWRAGLFAGFAYQDDEEVQTVTRGFHHTVRGRRYKVAEGGKELEENGGRIGFDVRRDGADHRPSDTVKGRGKPGQTGIRR
jgi:hypothetical protein